MPLFPGSHWPRGTKTQPTESAPQIAEGTIAISKKKKKKKKGCPDKVSFLYDREVPLAHDEQECGRLVRQFRGDRCELSPVEDLVFKDEYNFASRTSIMVSEIFDFALLFFPDAF